MRGKKPVAKIVAIEPRHLAAVRLPASYRGKLSWTEDAFDPLTDEEFDEMGLGLSGRCPAVRRLRNDESDDYLLDTHTFLWFLRDTSSACRMRVREV